MAPPTQVHELSRAQKALTMLGVLLGLLLAALDQTIVATAGPAMQADLHIDAAHYPWLTTSYMVASTVMLPIYGKLSDLFGRKPILVASILLFVVGSVLCGLSRSTLHVILSRVVQGLGSAGLFTSAFTVVADLFPPAVRGKYQGFTSAVFALSSVVGPLLGGFLTDHFSWHWVFFINLPVGVVALAFILLKMPPLHPARGETRPRLDLAGALALMLAVVPLLLALSLGRGGAAPPGEGGYPWGSLPILGLLGLSCMGLVLFVLAERRASDPLLDLGLFRNRIFAVGNATVCILGAGFLSAVVFLPLFMVNVVSLSATRSGLTLTPLTLGVVAGNVLAGQLVARIGRYRLLMLGSLVVLTLGYALMGFTLTPESTQAEVTAKMVLVGLGMGPSLPLYTLAIQNAVPPGQMGVATSAVTFFRQMGSTVGVALLGTVFAATLASSVATGTARATASLPPEVRERIHSSGTGGSGGEGMATGQALPREHLEANLREGFAARKHEVEARLDGPARTEALSRLEAEEARAVAAVGEVEQALKDGFTRSISAIYRIAILISVLGFLLTLFLPERPLRRTNAPLPAE
ncbi:MDR family MFS transporter [Archangium sp.]|uniref:MDR family MFS transporter n=1 Tax=Archangium sp. TaxID=1872627 RepID=UPI002D6C1AA7|nr:MDR family MFS transporter [Archangium sp.]HYO54630.1 MDR family MFS transporter [Archangium sp.]